MKEEIIINFRKITPEIAQEMIDKSNIAFENMEAKQRKIREDVVDIYATDMKEGKWDEENCETIKISKEGAIIDGQHRLRAIISSNIPVCFYVAEGLPISTIKTVDVGLNRSLESTLQILGKEYENGAAAIVRQKMNLDKHNRLPSSSSKTLKISRIEQVEEYEKNSILYDNIARFAKKIYKDSEQVMAVGEVGAIYAHLFMTMKKEQRIIEDFFIELAKYSNGSKTIFGVTYRRLKDKKTCRGADRANQYIACWNSYISGRRSVRDTSSDWFE